MSSATCVRLLLRFSEAHTLYVHCTVYVYSATCVRLLPRFSEAHTLMFGTDVINRKSSVGQVSC